MQVFHTICSVYLKLWTDSQPTQISVLVKLINNLNNLEFRVSEINFSFPAGVSGEALFS